MDSLTQVVLGAAVGEAVLGKKIGYRAMVWGGIAGTIPDLDVLLRFFTDPISATELHRGFSHSLLFSILLSPILAWVALKIHKKRDTTRKEWTWLFFLALVTHPLLDAHTTWGTQFFWPFDLRLAYKNIFVVDPLYTVPFLICLLIALFLKPGSSARRKFNNAGLIISTTYMALTFVLKGIGYSNFSEGLKEQGIEYVEMDTKPTPLNTLLWNAQIETKTGFIMAYYSVLDGDKKIKFSHEYAKNHHLLDPIREKKVVQQLIHIAAGWYTVEKEGDDLIFTDLRFGQIGVDQDNSPFIWRYRLSLDEDGEVKVDRPQPSFKGGLGSAFSDLATRVTGG